MHTNSPFAIHNSQFLHDRVQQAAYALIDEEEKKSVHLKIGRLLQKNSPDEALEERIFTIVEHLNKGIELIENQSEKNEIARLNLIAGKKAKSSLAYQEANKYLSIALDLLPKTAWQTDYSLMLSIHLERAESEYLNTHFDETLQLFEIITANATGKLEQIKITDLVITLYTNLGDMAQAVKYGRQAVALLGIHFPEDIVLIKQSVTEKMSVIQKKLHPNAVKTLLKLPEMTHPEKKALMNILVKCVPPAYQTQPDLVSLIIITMVETSLEYGNAVSSSYGYDMYAILVGAVFEDYELSYNLGEVAMTLLADFNDTALNGAVYFVFANFVSHWKKPLKDSLVLFKKGFKGSIEGGDYIHTGYCASRFLVYSLLQGNNLEVIADEAVKYVDFLVNKKDLTCSQVSLLTLQMIRCLKGETETVTSFDGRNFTEKDFEKTFRDNFFSLSHYYLFKLMIYYLFEDDLNALQIIPLADAVMHGAVGSMIEVEYNFYNSLLITRIFLVEDEKTQIKNLERLKNNQQKMKIWADSCPANYLHKHLLIEAEMARLTHQDLEAMNLYDQAIESARENGFIQNKALANELAAKFWLSLGKYKFTQTYLKDAHYTYQQCGAIAKVTDLEEKYPHFLTQQTSHPFQTESSILATTRMASTQCASTWLDLDSVIKASQTISEEIALNRLLKRMMHIVIENAGAEKGFLLLPQQDNWFIEAEGLIDSTKVTVLQSIALERSEQVSANIIHYVVRTQKNVVLHDATQESHFIRDPYVVKHRPKSILCTPLLNQGSLTGILYLENNLMTGAFTADRLETLNVLSSQIAVSIENSLLYKNLEKKVAERTQELSKALEHLKTTQAQLVESEKMASLGGLVAGVAHEINTPIGIGVTAATTLANQTKKTVTAYDNKQLKGSALKAYFDTAFQGSQLISNNLERAAKLIQSFKQVAVDQSRLEKRSFALKQYIQETLINLKPHLKKKQHQVIVNEDERIEINSYPGAFSQIITNLVMNSLNHAYSKGEAGHLIFELKLESEHLIVKYSDDGCGIPSAHLKKLFEPFFTTARAKGGTGLGLHIVYNIVTQKLHGTISVESEVGVGSTFIIKLPLSTAD